LAWRYAEIAIIDIVDKVRCVGVCDVVSHHAADTLQSDKGIKAIADACNRNAFGFRTFVIATIFFGVVGIAGVEVCREALRRNLLELVTAIPNKRAIIAPN
jgi:hypothetical protein